MAHLGPRNCSSNNPLNRTNLCSSEPSIVDTVTLAEISATVQEVYREKAGDVGVKMFDLAHTTSNLYGESTGKAFLAAVTVKGIVNVDPMQKFYIESGIREPIDIAVKFATADLVAAGVGAISVVDRITFAGKEYSVYQVNQEGFVQNTPMVTLVVGKIFSGQAAVNQP